MRNQHTPVILLTHYVYCLYSVPKLNTLAGLLFMLGRSINSFASDGALATNMTKMYVSVPTTTTTFPQYASSRAADTISIRCSLLNRFTGLIENGWYRSNKTGIVGSFSKKLPVNIIAAVDVLDDLRFCSMDLVKVGPWLPSKTTVAVDWNCFITYLRYMSKMASYVAWRGHVTAWRRCQPSTTKCPIW